MKFSDFANIISLTALEVLFSFNHAWAGTCYCNMDTPVFSCHWTRAADSRDECARYSRGHGIFVAVGGSAPPPTAVEHMECKIDYKDGDIDYGFSLKKDGDRKWELQLKGSTVYTFSSEELHKLYGGRDIKRVETGCNQSYVGHDYFAVKFGWNHDLMIAFGLQKDADGKLKSLHRADIYLHENNLQAETSEDLFLQCGNDNDLHVRYCWNKNGNQKWLRSTDLREAPSEGIALNRANSDLKDRWKCTTDADSAVIPVP